MAMPATTTLKLPDNLKKRIAPLAESAGKTAHAWMVEAIETQAILAEKRKAFIADARAAEKEVERTGQLLGKHARDEVAAATGGKSHDNPHRPGGILLRQDR